MGTCKRSLMAVQKSTETWTWIYYAARQDDDSNDTMCNPFLHLYSYGVIYTHGIIVLPSLSCCIYTVPVSLIFGTIITLYIPQHFNENASYIHVLFSDFAILYPSWFFTHVYNYTYSHAFIVTSVSGIDYPKLANIYIAIS